MTNRALLLTSCVGLGLGIGSLVGCGDSGRGTAQDLSASSDGNPGAGDMSLDMPVQNPDMLPPPDLSPPCVSDEPPPGKGKTGDPCKVAKDCLPGAGVDTTAACITSNIVNGNRVTWPSGFCGAPCDPFNNDSAMGINSDCPGSGTCIPSGDAGYCVSFCTGSNNCRSCYKCALASDYGYGCFPASVGECDPKVRGVCPDLNGSPQTCHDIGYGDIGLCAPRCDPFAATGCPSLMSAHDCHVNDQTGEGYCSPINDNGNVVGDSCGLLDNDCPSGYGCLAGHCFKYCNDANKTTQCTQGAICKPIKTLDTKYAGICSNSL